MKKVTLSIINDADGSQVAAFEKACEELGLTFTRISPKSEKILDYSVSYIIDAHLFILGQFFQTFKIQLRYNLK